MTEHLPGDIIFIVKYIRTFVVINSFLKSILWVSIVSLCKILIFDLGIVPTVSHNGQKKKIYKDKQRSTKHIHKTEDRVTRTPLKTGGELRCSGRISSSI
jgi:hypothetical protein